MREASYGGIVACIAVAFVAGVASLGLGRRRAIERKRYTVHGENGARANVRPGKQVALSGGCERNKSNLYVQSQIFGSEEFCHTLKKRVDGQIPGRMDLSLCLLIG